MNDVALPLRRPPIDADASLLAAIAHARERREPGQATQLVLLRGAPFEVGVPCAAEPSGTVLAVARRLLAGTGHALHACGAGDVGVVLAGSGRTATGLVELIRAELCCDTVGEVVLHAAVEQVGDDDDDAACLARARRALTGPDESLAAHGGEAGAAAQHSRDPREVRVAALAWAVRTHDPAGYQHGYRVAGLATQLATVLDLDAERVRTVARAALLHDVGRLGVPDRIVFKAGALDRRELRAMRRHAELGARMLASLGLAREARLVFHHHERVDGRGYPSGLRGEAIPLECRILLAAEAFDTLTAYRPYRAAAAGRDALAELRRHSGRQLDPACVAALERAVRHRRDVG